MDVRSRILLEAFGLFVLLVLTLVGYGWLLVYLGLRIAGVVMLLGPVAFFMLMFSAYGFYMGWERRLGRAPRVPLTKITGEVLTLVGYSLVLLLLAVGALYFYWGSKRSVALLFAVPAVWVLVALLRTLRHELDRSHVSTDQGEVIYRPADQTFEHRFRIVVFTFLLVLIWTCGLCLIAVGSIQNGILLVLVGLVASPWLIKRIREDRRHLRPGG